MVHIIRLRGQWNIERIQLPNSSAGIRFTRHFGCSKGLQTAERVWLSIANAVAYTAVDLNGNSLGTIMGSDADQEPASQRCPSRFDITRYLQPRNVLVLDVSAGDQSSNVNEAEGRGAEVFGAEVFGSVQLEIE